MSCYLPTSTSSLDRILADLLLPIDMPYLHNINALPVSCVLMIIVTYVFMPQSEIWSGLNLKFGVSLQSGFMRSFSKFDASDMIIFCFSFLAITMDYVTFKFGVVVQGAVQVFCS